MWTMEELMELKTPFLTMQDITKKDWEHLDFEFEGDSFEGYYYHKMRENDNYVKYTYFC